MASGKTIEQIEQEKHDRLMNTVAFRGGYYRANPHRFVTEVLGIKLKLFQQILLYAMVLYNYVMYLAARGQGKSFLTAIFACVRCILWPGTKIVISSGTLSQANEVLLKIKDELMPKSAFLRNEISSIYVNQNKGEIYFRNHSWIKTRTSSDNSRSARANCIIIDEFRMVDKTILDTVLRKFLSSPRHPAYLDKKEYKHLQERNKEIYLSSCWMKDHWSWEKAQAYTMNFFDDKKKYWICGLPYQLSIMEGLYLRSQAEDEMSEADFSETLWSMEMGCLWLGDTEGSFFKLDDFNKRRILDKGLYPLSFYNSEYQVPEPEYPRILSLDIALMASNRKKKNDASAFFINDLEMINELSYKSNIVYGESHEGMITDELGLMTMRYFHKYKCTHLVLDANGCGLGVYDYITKPHYDPETGEEYPAMTCINDSDMADRCKDPNAIKVVYSVKASQKFNTQICILLRDGIRNGRINFLKPELLIDEYLKKAYKPFTKLSPTEKTKIKMGYLQTTLAGYELIKLKSISMGAEIKVKEQSGARKDRYSSLAYNQWCANQLELELKPSYQDTQTLVSKLASRMRKAKYL